MGFLDLGQLSPTSEPVSITQVQPTKRINEQRDVAQFAVSPAKKRLSAVVTSLARCVAGCEVPSSGRASSDFVQEICSQLQTCSDLVAAHPPETMRQRFGNPSFRKWLNAVTSVKEFQEKGVELMHYFANSFGSAQRIDYGTGHELNFVAYFDGAYRMADCPRLNGEDVLLVFSQYFDLCRLVIRTYNLEPAGSHGVWGLDDHFHLPYILGAAQLSTENSRDEPSPKDVLNIKAVDQNKSRNLYFGAIAFIYEVKKGPFFEHSPMLYDVSDVKSWAKISGGMIKMYEGEVLSKFPVVQHFYFGNLFPYN